MKKSYVLKMTQKVDGEEFGRFMNENGAFVLNSAENARRFENRDDAEDYAECELCDPKYDYLVDPFYITVEEV